MSGTEALVAALIAYACVGGLWALYNYEMWNRYRHGTGTKITATHARALLATPIWPIPVLYLAARETVRLIRELIRDAKGA